MKAKIINAGHRILTPAIIKLGSIGTVKQIIQSAYFTLTHANEERPSPEALDRYTNPEIGGYAPSNGLTKDELDKFRFKAVLDYFRANPQNIIEIGCASGDILGVLAKEQPTKTFEGIDFSVEFAQKLYSAPNLTFRKGYFLDMDWKGEALVMISTATCLLPKELHAAFKQAKQAGVKTIVLSEPWWWNQSIKPESRDAVSVHAKYVCWNHNYPGYLNKHGYKITQLQRVPEKTEVEKLFIVAQL